VTTRIVWDLPAGTHSKFVTSMCGLSQLKVELACRCVKLIGKCLNSSDYVVKHVAKQGVYFQRLYSPIGRNAHHCVTMVDASLSDIVSNTRKPSQASYAHHDNWLTESVRGKLKLISELLCIICSKPMKSVSLSTFCVLIRMMCFLPLFFYFYCY